MKHLGPTIDYAIEHEATGTCLVLAAPQPGDWCHVQWYGGLPAGSTGPGCSILRWRGPVSPWFPFISRFRGAEGVPFVLFLATHSTELTMGHGRTHTFPLSRLQPIHRVWATSSPAPPPTLPRG